MKFTRLLGYALCGSVFAIAGCSSGGSQPSPVGLTPPLGQSFATHAPRPSNAKILFVSLNYFGVELFDFPSGNYIGPLTPPPGGFAANAGECRDNASPQNVFIANEATSTIDQYSHSGTLVTVLNDPGQYPTDCSYRSTGPASGVLAVSNYAYTSPTQIGPGSISIYTRNGTTWSGPVTYTPPNFVQILSLDYKNNMLYFDGTYGPPSYPFAFARMTQSGNFFTIPLTGGACPCNITYPGGVQTIGSYIAVGDANPQPGSPNVYHVMPSGQVAATTTFAPANNDYVPRFFHIGQRLVAADFYSPIEIYSYPGGNLQNSITPPNGYYGAAGVVVSQ